MPVNVVVADFRDFRWHHLVGDSNPELLFDHRCMTDLMYLKRIFVAAVDWNQGPVVDYFDFVPADFV